MKTSLLLNKLLLLGAALILSACSTQNREAIPQVDGTELNAVIDDFQKNLSNKSMDAFTADSGKAIAFYAREQSGRPATSVVAIHDLNAIDSQFDVLLSTRNLGIVETDVMFMDTVNGSDREFSLLIRFVDQNGRPYYYEGTSAPNNYTFTDDIFETSINMPAGNIIVRSTDLSENYNNELADSIKLTLYVEENGSLFEIGQISTMAGYGIR